MGRDSDSMRSVFKLCVEEIEKVLKGSASITDKTRLAAHTLLSYSKIKSADIQEMALEAHIRGAKPKEIGGRTAGVA